MIGLRLAAARISDLTYEIRAPGKVTFDETRLTRIHSRVEGWVDEVYADFVGKPVEKGEPLVSIYSPELLAAHQELLLALRNVEILSPNVAQFGFRAERLVESARKRLELLGMSSGQVDSLVLKREPLPVVAILAPASGVVVSRNAFPRQRVTPETELYVIADLRRVWIVADVFELDIPRLKVGLPATVRSLFAPLAELPARVEFIHPQIDPTSRTVKVRLAVNNPSLDWRPEMFVEVSFRIRLPRRIVVPRDAILDSGQQKWVFIDLGNGYLEPRQVQTGQVQGELVEILSGLSAGEEVVASGTFLIDSESRLKAALDSLGSRSAPVSSPGHSGPPSASESGRRQSQKPKQPHPHGVGP